MKRKLLLICLLLLPTFLVANDKELGEKLTYKLWNDIKGHKNRVKSYISPAFQETIPSEQIRRNAKEELENVRDTNVSKFKITSLRTTRKHDVLVVTYFIQIDVIENNHTTSLPNAIRLTTWKKVDGKWTWIAHQGGL
jgi:hypothetical protein